MSRIEVRTVHYEAIIDVSLQYAITDRDITEASSAILAAERHAVGEADYGDVPDHDMVEPAPPEGRYKRSVPRQPRRPAADRSIQVADIDTRCVVRIDGRAPGGDSRYPLPYDPITTGRAALPASRSLRVS